MHGGEIVIIVLFVIVVVAAGIFSIMSMRRRRQELMELAEQLGFSFNPGKDSTFASGWGFLGKLQQGDQRYAFNILGGTYREHQMFVFDYHFRTGSGKSAQDHLITCVLLIVQEAFPQLTIGSESVFSRLAQALGYEDIDFESAEFSRAFCVRSKDKKFAYDVCNAQMIEYLLANRDIDLEIQGPALLLVFGKQLPADEIEFNLQRLVEIRSRLPGYLFTKT